MRSMVVMTYYQLMHAIAMALTFEEKPILYFSLQHIDVDEEFLEGIRKTNVFSKVVGITRKGEFSDLLRDLEKFEKASDEEIDEIGSTLFDKHLEPHYSHLFKDANFNEPIYVYNDFQWHYYYIEKHFKNIIGVEDGYRSLLQQIRVHWFRERRKVLKRFINKYYPAPLYKSDKVTEIISSCDFEELDDYYRKKLKVLDFNDLVTQNLDLFQVAMKKIFHVPSMDIPENSVLLLGQPLSRGSVYCSAIEEYLLTRKYIRSEIKKGKTVYYKPHPAEVMDPRIYCEENLVVLNKDFPVEMLNFFKGEFDKAISFSSTAVGTLTCVKSTERIAGSDLKGAQAVNRFIKEQIAGEVLLLDVWCKLTDLTFETYMNIYSFLYRKSPLKTRVHVVVEKERYEESKDFLSINHFKKNLEQYKKRHTFKGICPWEKELKEICQHIEKYGSIEIIPCDSLDNWHIWTEHVCKRNDMDYAILVEEGNFGQGLLRNLMFKFKKNMQVGIVFQNHMIVEGKGWSNNDIPINPGYFRRIINGRISNRVWSKRIIHETSNLNNSMDFALMLKDYTDIARKYSDSMQSPLTDFTSISNGHEYYGDQIQTVVERVALCEEKDRDFAAGQIMMILMDYFDWLKINEKRETSDEYSIYNEAFKLLEERVQDEDIKKHVILHWMEGAQAAGEGRYRIVKSENYILYEYLRLSGRFSPVRNMSKIAGKVKRGVKKIFRKKDDHMFNDNRV